VRALVLLVIAVAILATGCAGSAQISDAEALWCGNHMGDVYHGVDNATLDSDTLKDLNDAFYDPRSMNRVGDGKYEPQMEVLKAHGKWNAPCKAAYAAR
jgi:hypothetical protein